MFYSSFEDWCEGGTVDSTTVTMTDKDYDEWEHAWTYYDA